MRHFPQTLALLSLLLVAQAGWGFSPYFPPPGYGYAPPHGQISPYRGAPSPAYPAPAYFRPQPPYAWIQPVPRPAVGHKGISNTPTTTRPIATAPAATIDKTADSKPAVPTPAKNKKQPSTGKPQFLVTLQPMIETENRRLLDLREKLTALIDRLEQGDRLSDAQRKNLQTLAQRYRVEGDPLQSAEARLELLGKVDVVPTSLALAQAANESAWGKSRFAKEGNNLFGIWTYDENKGIVPRKRAPGKKHLVRKFDSIAESVRYYLFTLNSHPAYETLRDIRAGMRDRGQPLDGLAMADGLTRYSAKGKEYVRTIQDMIRRFDLASYDGSQAGKA